MRCHSKYRLVFFPFVLSTKKEGIYHVLVAHFPLISFVFCILYIYDDAAALFHWNSRSNCCKFVENQKKNRETSTTRKCNLLFHYHSRFRVNFVPQKRIPDPQSLSCESYWSVRIGLEIRPICNVNAVDTI